MDMKQPLKPGDVFLSENTMVIGDIISQMERVRARDNNALYSHAGIILDDIGTTYEALQSVRNDNLFSRYRGKKVLVARYKLMDKNRFDFAYTMVKSHNGNWYPVHRLFLHLLNVAKYIHQDSVVCSELTARFLHFACRKDGIFEFEHYLATHQTIFTISSVDSLNSKSSSRVPCKNILPLT